MADTPSAWALKAARDLITKFLGEPCDPQDAEIKPIALALDAAYRAGVEAASKCAEKIIVRETSAGWRGIPDAIRALPAPETDA